MHLNCVFFLLETNSCVQLWRGDANVTDAVITEDHATMWLWRATTYATDVYADVQVIAGTMSAIRDAKTANSNQI